LIIVEGIKIGVRFSYGTALSVDAKALNNEASAHAYNPKGREKEVRNLILDKHAQSVILIIMNNIGKVYELIRDGETIQTERKCREGLKEIMDSIESYIDCEYPHQFQLSVYCTEYNEYGFPLDSELVQNFEVKSPETYGADL
jgi:hypothetical protein